MHPEFSKRIFLELGEAITEVSQPALCTVRFRLKLSEWVSFQSSTLERNRSAWIDHREEATNVASLLIAYICLHIFKEKASHSCLFYSYPHSCLLLLTSSFMPKHLFFLCKTLLSFLVLPLFLSVSWSTKKNPAWVKCHLVCGWLCMLQNYLIASNWFVCSIGLTAIILSPLFYCEKQKTKHNTHIHTPLFCCSCT